MIRYLIRRPYLPYRRAYRPRIWPAIVVSSLAVGGLCVALNPGLLWSAALGAVVGFVVPSAYLVIWRRRHPVITDRERTEDLRRAARWN